MVKDDPIFQGLVYHFPRHFSYATFLKPRERVFTWGKCFMEIILFSIVFTYTMILWIVVLVMYSTFIESFDFGYLPTFAWKSAILVALVSLVVAFVPFGGFLALVVWWIGLAALFRMDFWECRVLVFLIWGVNLLLGFAISAAIHSALSSAA